MKQVIEKFFEKTSEIKVKDPYIYSLELMDKMKKFGKIRERKNSVMVSTTRAKINVNFDIIKFIDDNTKVIMNITAKGDIPGAVKSTLTKATGNIGELTVKITATSKITYKKSTGAIRETFNEFYHKRLLPEFKKLSKTHAKHLVKEADKTMKSLAKKFSA